MYSLDKIPNFGADYRFCVDCHSAVAYCPLNWELYWGGIYRRRAYCFEANRWNFLRIAEDGMVRGERVENGFRRLASGLDSDDPNYRIRDQMFVSLVYELGVQLETLNGAP